MKRNILFGLIVFSFFYAEAAKVEVKIIDNKYVLYKDGQPFFIKGAGGTEYLDKLKEYGANSIRIWSTHNAVEILDRAHSLGLYVTVGLNIELERRGFNYNDSLAIQKQFEEVKADVIKLKDHPALLMWGVGNELDQLASNPNVWNAMNDIIKMIHELDPYHPTTTMLAGVPRHHIKYILERCPLLDILSINSFKDLPNIRYKITDAGWTGPYIISEWGASGYWEVDTTSWGASIEETSSEKAEICFQRYTNAILANTDRCLGSYVFYWGEKQARTNTFLSIILEGAEETETVDVLKYLWDDHWPANRAPKISSILLDKETSNKSLLLKPGTLHTAKVEAKDPENHPLLYFWEIRQESNEKKVGGDTEKVPAINEGLIKIQNAKQISFQSPQELGAYRLYVYVKDGDKNIATANFPFYVARDQSDVVKSAYNY